MAARSCFSYTIKWVSNEYGDIVILPDEADLSRAERELQEVEGELARLAAQKGGDAAPDAAPPSAHLLASARATALRDWLARARRVLAAHGPNANTWEFRLHRWSYLERELAIEAARVTGPDGVTTTIDDGKFRLGILARCLESWSLDREISEESIVEELPPVAIDRLAVVLRDRSEASIDTLPFPGADSTGPDRGQPGRGGQRAAVD